MQRIQRTLFGPAGAAALAVPILVLASACESEPEYAPHTPISGVDRPHANRPEPAPEPAPPPPSSSEQEEPQDGTAAAPSADPFDAFTAAIAERLRLTGGRVAVFPALSGGPGASVGVSGAGDHLMTEAARRLERTGLGEVVSGARLAGEIEAVNRATELVCSPGDAESLARAMGFDYVVCGTVDHERSAIENRESVEIDYACRSLVDGGEVAALRAVLTARSPARGLAAELARRATERGSWRVCAPESVTLSLEKEIRLESRALARAFFETHGDALAPDDGAVRLSVLPTVLPGTARESNDLLAFGDELLRELDRAMEGAPDGADPTGAALARPVTVRGRSFTSFDDALAEYGRMRRALADTDVGRLGESIARALADGFGANGVVPVELVPAEDDRATWLGLVRREALSASDRGDVDPESVAWLQTKGTEVVVESRLYDDLDGEPRLGVRVTRLEPFWSGSQDLALQPHFVDLLSARLRR